MRAESAAPPCPHCGNGLAADAPDGLCPTCLVALGIGGPPHDLADGSDPVPELDDVPEIPLHALAALTERLEILDSLGRGGSSFVYKARQRRLNRIVALKILAPARQHDPPFAERFSREAELLARLAHPSIVTIHEFGIASGLCFFVMEFVEGPNLREILRRGLPPASQTISIVADACRALQFAHDHGIVHRDIKPENLLVDARGRVKIADFGIAKLTGSDAPPTRSLTETNGVLGTPHYMAPEQIETPGLVDHRADVFSIGVVLYELLTGELPLGKFPNPAARRPISPELDALVMRALDKDPERRPQRVDEIETILRSVQDAAPPPVVPIHRPVGLRTSAVRGRRFYRDLFQPHPGRLGETTHRSKLSALHLGAIGIAILLPAWGLYAFLSTAKPGGSFILTQERPAGDSTLATPSSPRPPAVPPVVVSTTPVSGSSDVDPTISELRVTFSKRMTDGNWSWVFEDAVSSPELRGTPHFDADGRTCVLPVRLVPGRTYAVWLNRDNHANFRDRDGLAAIPYLLIFATRPNSLP